MVDEAVISRFRSRVADLRALEGALAQIEREANDWRGTALLDLNREIAIVEPTTKSVYLTVVEKAKARLAQLRARVAEVDAELARLAAERDRLAQRRDAANLLACKCRDFLRERGMLTPELEF